jgi:magnesium transporter
MKRLNSKSISDHLTKRFPMFYEFPNQKLIVSTLTEKHFDCIELIFICSKDQKLAGAIHTKEILIEKPESNLAKFLFKVIPIQTNDSLENAANLAASQHINCLPVVNVEGKLIGVLTAETIIQTLKEEHTSDLQVISGIRQNVIRKKFKKNLHTLPYIAQRIPWLLVGVAGSYFTSVLMSSFNHVLEKHISMVFFIPGIVYLADAIGTQTETFTIRSMTLTKTTLKQNLSKEILSGIIIGIILGLLSFLLCIISGFEPRVGLVLLFSMSLTGIFSSLTGVFLPWTISKFGYDPAFGSGPLATILQDILSLLVYLLSVKFILTG